MNSEKFLIISAIIVLLIVIGYLVRKRVRLFFVRKLYGPFSYEYLNIHKKYFFKSPYHYCFRDEFMTHLIQVLFHSDDVPSYKSDKDLIFEDISHSMNYKDFIGKKGDPHCFNAFKLDQLGFEIKALGYKLFVSGSKAITVYYFMNDLFFMGEYYFKNPKTDIKAGISEIYLEKMPLPEDIFYIRNSKDRIIYFKNTGNKVDIKYLNKEDQSIINNLKDYYNFKTGKKM
jgi:hypothetical protein